MLGAEEAERCQAPVWNLPLLLLRMFTSRLLLDLSMLVGHGLQKSNVFESVMRPVEWDNTQRHSNMKHLLTTQFISETEVVSGEVEVNKIWFLSLSAHIPSVNINT